MYCKKCGLKNKDNADFCTKCGTKLEIKDGEKSVEEDISKQVEKAGVAFERAAKNFGDAAERVGKRIEQKMEKAGKGFEGWYDKKFGIFGPLIWSFLGIIILRLIIGVMAITDLTVLVTISDFLYEYFLLLFGLMLISSYNTYFYRKYKKQYRWISPLISTIVFIVIIWIIAQIFIIIDTPILSSIASFIDTYLPVIFVVIIILSYGFMMVILPFTKEKK